jgi:SAM-dependent methyltransferase
MLNASMLATWIRRPAKRALATVLGSWRYCPVCQVESPRFKPIGTPRRKDARCPNCRSLERHRLTWLFFQRHTNLFSGTTGKMLHVAPEACFSDRLRAVLGNRYVTCDLSRPGVDCQADITALPFPDDHFEVVYCSHVLEHVPDDRKAMRELHRVLSPGGWAVLLVPITAEKTYEDPSITEPEDRLRAFGQEDHVRRYGPDYVDRLAEAGFHVRMFTAKDLTDSESVRRCAIGTPSAGEVFYCTKVA